jgi:hypothetical protein
VQAIELSNDLVEHGAFAVDGDCERVT